MINYSFYCKLCGAGVTNPNYFYLKKTIELCFTCIDIVSNVYHERHSGEYLTWKNKKESIKKRIKLSKKTIKSVHEKSGYRCVKCGSFYDLSIDHIMPISAGGSNDESNLQTLCNKCNLLKGSKIL